MARPSRPQRTSVSDLARDVLTVSGKEEGFHYRWVNDSNNRVAQFKQGGYEVVNHAVDVGTDKVGNATAVGTVVEKPVGLGTNAVLMRIPDDWYAEDQAKIKGKNDESMAALQSEALVDRYGKLDISK